MPIRTLYYNLPTATVEVDVYYNILPGEEATYLTPKISDDVEIIDIEILEVKFWNDLKLEKGWFDSHSDWMDWLKSELFNHIINCEDCLEELLDAES
jgi:hypothetical protein